MYLIYQPEGADEPTRFRYQPRKLMSAEREALERRTGRDFTAFTQAVLAGNGLCRRALLHMFLKREHPGVKFEDVDFAWDDLRLEYSKQELQAMRETAAEASSSPETAEHLEALDREIATAIDDEGGPGKAPLPIAG